MHMHMRMANMHISIMMALLFFTVLPPSFSIYERIITSYAYFVNRQY